MSTVTQIQERLLGTGFLPGEIDGAWGRRAIAATKAFQRSSGLEQDGIVGPLTFGALFPNQAEPAAAPMLPWLEEARNLLGTRELMGARSNPMILDWANSLDLHYPGDDVPWCGLFVAHCVGASMPEEILPQNPLGARQWERFGEPTAPRLGAIMVFWRESQQSGKGHVGFYTGEDNDGYRVLGGNQNDRVCLAWIDRKRLTKARWPRTGVDLTGGGPVLVRNRAEEVAATEA